MITAELNTALAEDVLSSVPPEVSFDDEADEVEHYLQQYVRSLDRGNANAKDRILAEWWLGRYLDGTVTPGGRRSREGTAGRFTGAKRSLPDWVTKQQKLRMSKVGKVDKDFIERYFTETEAAGDEITRAGLLDLWALHLEDQEDDIDDDEGTDDEDSTDDEEQDDDETDQDDYPTQKTLTLPMSVGEGRTFDANRTHLRDAVMAEIQRLRGVANG